MSEPMHKVVEQYKSLVQRIGHHLLLRLPAGVQFDDLVQAGMIGLLEAAKRYDPTKGASFETYAGIRIRGHMLDEVRRNDWAPRSVYRNARRVAEAAHTIESKNGKNAHDKEIAAEMGVSLEEYHHYLQESNNTRLVNLDDLCLHEESVDEGMISRLPTPQQGLERDKFQSALLEAIKTLPEREQQVLALYYDEELNLKEIGQVLSVTESRVCQIHSNAMKQLRTVLAQWQDADL